MSPSRPLPNKLRSACARAPAAAVAVLLFAASPADAASADWTATPPASPLARNITPLRRDETGRIVPIPPAEARGDENRTDSGRRKTGRIGHVKRDAEGRIVRAEPTDRAVPDPAPAWIPNDAEYDAAAREAQRQVTEVQRICRRRESHGHGGLDACLRPLLDHLAARDSEVRAHELAHYHAGRPFTRAPRYWYVTGPKGRRYAVTGTTAFEMTPVPGNPAATRRKWHQLKRAALAPQSPSPRDLKIAAEIDRRLANLPVR